MKPKTGLITRLWYGVLAAFFCFSLIMMSPVRPIFASPPLQNLSVPAKIGELQGNGLTSPFSGTVQTVGGVVTGLKYDADGKAVIGFFMQDTGDGNPATSDGIFVFRNSNPAVRLGQVVTATGRVEEYFNLTQLNIVTGTLSISAVTSPLPDAVPLNPPADALEAARYMEQYESMRVTVPGTARIVAPTNRFWEFGLVTGGTERVFQREKKSGLVIGVDDGGGPATRAVVRNGDSISGLVGPLDYAFNVFKILPQPDALPSIFPGSDITGQVVGRDVTGSKFSVASFNVENFFDTIDDPVTSDDVPTLEQYQAKLEKLEKAIAVNLNSPTVIGFQEVENTTVLNDLFNRPLLSSKNYSYTVGLRTDSRGIKVALAYQRDKVKVLNTFSYQCYIRTSTLVTLSDRNATFNCNNTTDPSNPIGSTGLYARAPLVVEAEIRPEGEGGPVLPVVFISNHFKAKSGTQIPEDPEYDLRRANEGRELAKLVDSLVAGGKANVIVMGDLNDYESSPALQELTSGKSALRNLTLEVPEQGRYSYIYNFVAQVLDHILVTPSLMQYFESARFALFDADTPYYLDIGGKRADDETSFAGSVSDHNPPLAIFNLRPGGLPELGVGGGAPKDEVNWQLWAIIGLSLLLVGAGALLALRRRKQ